MWKVHTKGDRIYDVKFCSVSALSSFRSMFCCKIFSQVKLYHFEQFLSHRFPISCCINRQQRPPAQYLLIISEEYVIRSISTMKSWSISCLQQSFDENVHLVLSLSRCGFCRRLRHHPIWKLIKYSAGIKQFINDKIRWSMIILSKFFCKYNLFFKQSAVL